MDLSTHGLHLELRPACTADGEGWCRVQVKVRANGFRGEFESWLQLNDIERFKNQLSAMSASIGKVCIATLASAEPDIRMELSMHPLGNITGRYALESERRDGIATMLSGAFDLDQSFLPSLQQGIDELLEQLQGTRY